MISLTLENMDSEFKNILKGKLDFLLDKAPSDSTLSSQVSKIKNAYEGAIEIVSTQGKFLSRSMSKDPNELVFDLVDDIYKQILNWRNRRILLLQ